MILETKDVRIKIEVGGSTQIVLLNPTDHHRKSVSWARRMVTVTFENDFPPQTFSEAIKWALAFFCQRNAEYFGLTLKLARLLQNLL